jgi:hypothetical protein
VAETLRLAKVYVSEREAVDRLVAAVPGATPTPRRARPAAPVGAALKALERAIHDTPELEPPLPSWQGLEQRQQQDRVHRRAGLQRKRQLTSAEQAELEQLNADHAPSAAVAMVGEQ